MYDPKDLDDSVKRLASGSTVGMVDAELKQKGLGSGPRGEVLHKARRIVNRRARIKHAMIFVFGVMVGAGGSFWLYHCIQSGITRVRLPGSLMFFGFLAAMYGLYFSFQDEV